MNIEEMGVWGLTKALTDVIESGYSFDEETGEVFFTSDDLEALQDTLDHKLNGLCGYIKFCEAKVTALKERKKEIDKNIKYYSNKAESLQSFLKTYMEANNITSTKDVGDYRLGFRKSNQISILDESSVYKYLEAHPELKESCTKVETSLSKTGLKEALSSGIEISGVSIVENKNVTIK